MDEERPVLTFFVPGEPVQQGSKKAWVNKKTGRAQMSEDAGVRHTVWRLKVTDAARAAWGKPPMTRPITITLTFRYARLISHYGSGRNAAQVKDSAPDYPAKPPDLDKLIRAVLDGITDAKVWADDSLVVSVLARKRWVDRYSGDQEGVKVAIGYMPLTERPAKPEQLKAGLIP